MMCIHYVIIFSIEISIYLFELVIIESFTEPLFYESSVFQVVTNQHLKGEHASIPTFGRSCWIFVFRCINYTNRKNDPTVLPL